MSEGKGCFRVALTAGTTTAGGDVLSLANPEGEDLIITRAGINVTTPATGAATLDVGVAAAATTTSDTLLDGIDVGTAAAIFDNIDDQGSNGQSIVLWPSDEFVTATPSATCAGLVGYMYIEYYRV